LQSAFLSTKNKKKLKKIFLGELRFNSIVIEDGKIKVKKNIINKKALYFL